MKVLVTGGAGFIGANLCRALAQTSDVSEVIALDDFSSGRRENLSGTENVKLLEGSVLDAPLIDEALSDAAAVVHLAARPSVPRSLADPLATHEANATGTLCVLEAARRCPLARRPLVIVASSSSVYGANPALPKREDAVPMPASPYAASKLASEAYSLAYARSFALPVLVFRFFNVFGPLQAADHAYAAVVPAFVSAALRGEPLTIHGTGTQTRDFTYVGSVVGILIDALTQRPDRPRAGEPGLWVSDLGPRARRRPRGRRGSSIAQATYRAAGGRRGTLTSGYRPPERPVPRGRGGAPRGRAAPDSRMGAQCLVMRLERASRGAVERSSGMVNLGDSLPQMPVIY